MKWCLGFSMNPNEVVSTVLQHLNLRLLTGYDFEILKQ